MKHTFCYFYLEKICILTLQGMTLKKISCLAGMPPVGVLYSWTKRYPVLKKAINMMKNHRECYKVETEFHSKLNFIKSCYL